MRETALFLNGVYRDVLDEIVAEQSAAPQGVLFLQPYSRVPIRLLKDNPPSPEAPVRLWASVSEDLRVVQYEAEIVGWEDKTALSPAYRRAVRAVLERHQPGELALFDGTAMQGSLNLLSVRHVTRVDAFPVTRLIKVRGRQPLSANRSRSGGWSPVHRIA